MSWAHKYAGDRNTSPILRYGLHKRSEAVATVLSEIPLNGETVALDIGTADGAMLAALRARVPNVAFIGLERLPELCQLAQKQGLMVVSGNAMNLPFPDQSFDVVLLSALLKHLGKSQQALAECRRVVAPGGHLIVTDPTPFGIWLGIKRGHFEPRYLPNIWSLREARRHIESEGFEVTRAFKYSLSPFHFPGVTLLEGILKQIHLTGTFLHQILLARRTV